MQEGRQEGYTKGKSPYIEMSVSRSNSYKVVAKKAAKKCHLNYLGSKSTRISWRCKDCAHCCIQPIYSIWKRHTILMIKVEGSIG